MTGSPPTSRSLARSVTDLSAAQVVSLATTPITLVSAQGPGTLITPVFITVEYVPGTEIYPQNVALNLEWGATGAATVMFTQTGLTSLIAAGCPASVLDDTAENAPLNLVAATSLALGPVATSSLGAGGTLYSVNDTGLITGGGNADCAYKVLSVDGITGAVITYSITAAGTNYAPANGVTTTADAGTGSGLTINILTVTKGDGTLRVTTLYDVITTV